MANDGKRIIYGTVDGLLYAMDPVTGASKKLYDIGYGTNLLIGGLSHIGDGQYYYSSVRENVINRLDTKTGEKVAIAKIKLADGLDLFNGKIYSVTYNKSDLLTIFDMNGTELYTLSTGIDDMVGIAHSDKYLYILSEDCNVYQTDAKTGKSRLVIRTDENFERRDSFGGAEAIDIFENHIYLSNVDDSSICRSGIDIRSFE
jgi:outer membrane protein assembly factor BamB